MGWGPVRGRGQHKHGQGVAVDVGRGHQAQGGTHREPHAVATMRFQVWQGEYGIQVHDGAVGLTKMHTALEHCLADRLRRTDNSVQLCIQFNLSSAGEGLPVSCMLVGACVGEVGSRMSLMKGLSSCVLRNALRFEHALKVQGCPHAGYSGETGSEVVLCTQALSGFPQCKHKTSK